MKKRILVCPLNWGLGHATRDIPLIRKFISQGHDVIIAAYGSSLKLLQYEFPELQIFELPGFEMKYSKGKSQLWAVLKHLPAFFFRIWKEHAMIEKIIDEMKIDTIISDCRYGLWTRKAHTVFITHQIVIKMPNRLQWLEQLVYFLNTKQIEKFNECWIPDIKGEESIAGELSGQKKRLTDKYKYIGLLSRFNDSANEKEKKYDVLFLLSGTEPQRSIFENKILKEFSQTQMKCLLIKGVFYDNKEEETYGNITVVPHLDSEGIFKAINESKIIVCRAGYSSIMDLVVLDKKAILSPTPGQPEQEYLAEYHAKRGRFIAVKQNEISVQKICQYMQNRSL